jgi:GH15 family glucan-1,4-alpha-glucosidase
MQTNKQVSGPLPPAHALPLGEYALIGDCRAAALISRFGSVDWLCLPYFSAPSIFAAILDPTAGHFAIRPTAPFRASRRYAGDTPVLETRFDTASGSVVVRDALVVLEGVSQLRPMRELVRIVENLHGEVELEAEIDIQPDYRRTRPRLRSHGACAWAILFGNDIIFVQSDAELQPDGTKLRARFRSVAGQVFRFSLSHTQGEIAVVPPIQETEKRVDETIAWWKKWSGGCCYQGSYRAAVIRSAITLKLLSYSLSGAIIAAPTTSLPETIGHDDTYDYRFCWLRDSGFIVDALTSLGFHNDAADYLAWLLHSTRLTWPRLRVLYDVYGRNASNEQILSHLSGYCDSRPVRVGNRAGRQLQLDVYGHVILAAEKYIAAGGRIDKAESRMLRGLGKPVCRDWWKPDSGLWEIRSGKRQYTFSKIMCWVALDRLLKLNARGHISLGASADRFAAERDAIAAAIESRGFNNQLQAYTGEFLGDRMDASLLLIPVLNYKPASDARFASTFQRIMERLSRNGLVYRYETGYGDKNHGENSFGICTFWAVEALTAQGRHGEAEEMFVNALARANDVGLFAEEIDPDNNNMTGNFPQGFTHVGLINAALALENPQRAQR